MTIPNSVDYSVHYNIVGTDIEYVPRTKRVSITKGYSTFEDIRKILAISVGLEIHNIDIDGLIKLEN